MSDRHDRHGHDTIASGWFKSRYSGEANGACVEVRRDVAGMEVRDSKDRDGGTLSFSSDAWSRWLQDLVEDKLSG
ncbi:hypothetical protein P3T36_000944 [Kitasatospora sp. MAP12-15]|uniref:DUF397 domain-containing protein n=1 Tax=unclassified Kitasatospora TaxID=2633591 RepID=UPI002476EF38|nr:DUF397 domain-containing protein [Kitasatospora sp. MAP12-44]MDH6114544.1 hypothetical protein [Kitasatospora sp. MAP12-44]